MAFCGLRIGEVTGLQRSDLTLIDGAFIQRQVIWRRKKDSPPGSRAGSWWNQNRRPAGVVEIPAALMPFLVAHLQTLSGVPNPLDLV
jgi:integrase